MASNYRRHATTTSENKPTILPGKNAIETSKDNIGVTKRHALGEIINQINNREVLKKPSAVGQAKPEIKLTKTTSTTSIVQIKNKKGTSKLDNAVCTKKTEIIKKTVVHKVETDCIVKQQKEIKSYSSQRLDVVEDENCGNDPQFVSEYINDIYSYLRSLESKYSIDELFLACHRTTFRMRCVLINWLVEVHINFHMLPESLHLCIAIVDRYLQKNKSIGRENLQLVGITALWIAGKYEEMYIADIVDFVYVGNNSFTKEELFSMELSIIKALGYSFGRPLSLHFLRRYSRIAKAQPQHHTLAKYFLELALFDHELCHFRPSLQAAAAIYLALSVLSDSSTPSRIWSRTMVHYSAYTFSDMEKVIKLIAAAVVKMETSKFQAIRNKYATASNGKISLCPELKGPVILKFAQNK